MALPLQTSVLLRAARQIVDDLPADAVLLLTETDLDWDDVQEILPADKLLVCPTDIVLTHPLQDEPILHAIETDPGPSASSSRTWPSSKERWSSAATASPRRPACTSTRRPRGSRYRAAWARGTGRPPPSPRRRGRSPWS